MPMLVGAPTIAMLRSMHQLQFLTIKLRLGGYRTIVATAIEPVKWLLLVIHSGSGSDQAASLQTGRRASGPRLHQYRPRLERVRDTRLPQRICRCNYVWY